MTLNALSIGLWEYIACTLQFLSYSWVYPVEMVDLFIILPFLDRALAMYTYFHTLLF
jgi:hypothetical protein